MNRIRLFVAAMTLAFAVPAIAQDTAPAPARQMPTVDQHLKALSDKLSLTADQQEKARPILQQMQDSIQRLMNDKTLTPEQMHEQMRPARMKADKQLRELLNDEQKKKLDDLESQHHPDLHPQP
jgi:Spy/CpxP family protein refolding chaperone